MNLKNLFLMAKTIEFVGFSYAANNLLLKCENSLEEIQDWKSFSQSLRKLSNLMKSYEAIMQETNAEA